MAELPDAAVKAYATAIEQAPADPLDAVEAALSALPSEWLLARALTPAENGALREGLKQTGTFDAGWTSAKAKLHDAAALLEQEAGGER